MRRRALLAALAGGSLSTAGCLARARALIGDEPLPEACVEDPTGYYGDGAFDAFDPVGTVEEFDVFEPIGTVESGPPFYGGHDSVNRHTTVPEGTVDDLDKLPNERRISGRSAFRTVYDAEPEEWPERRRLAWAALEATREVMDHIDEFVADWRAVRAHMHVSGIHPRVSSRFDWTGIRLKTEVAVVLQYRLVCRENHDGDIEADQPATPFDTLIAATPKDVEVDLTMGTTEVQTRAPVILDWYYNFKPLAHAM